MRLSAASPIQILYDSGLFDIGGNPAHAATYIRRRLIVMDRSLRRKPREHLRILVHEILHFAWVRIGNSKRRNWEELLKAERGAGARGEAGWSAEWRKKELTRHDAETRTVRWREYCCESFCDTGALIVSGQDAELTLASRYLERRLQWFQPLLAGELPI